MTEPDQIEAGNTLPLETVQQDLDQNHADPGPEPTWNETESRAGPGRLKQTQLLDNADSFNHPKGFRLIALTSGMMAVVLMVALDNYILATAVPRISTQFHSLNAVGWYASSYFLTQMTFQPAFGRLFDDISPKWVFVLAMAIFELGSILCAVAPSSPVLIFGRLVAGTGGAGLYVGTLVLISHAVPIKSRPFYLSIVTSMFGVASFLGPVLGGVFTDSEVLTWRFCFWINLPIGFVAFLLIATLYQPPPRQAQEKRTVALTLIKLDPIGIVTLIAAFLCFTLALQWANITYPWSNPHVWGCILGFTLLIFAFIADQVFMKDRASIPWRIISQRTVAASSGFILFIQAIVGVLIYYLPFYFQAVRGTNAQDSGVRNLPFLVTLLFAPMVSGALISYFGPYVPFMWFGAVFATIGSSLLFTLTPHTRHQAVNAYQIIAGLGLGSCNQIPFSATQYKLPEEKLIMGSTMVSFCVSLGPVLGTNMAQAIFAGLLVEQLEGLPGVDAVSVIRAGPTAIDQKVPSESRIAVRQVFNYALTRAFIPLIVYGSLAICCSLAMEWGNVRKQRNQGSE